MRLKGKIQNKNEIYAFTGFRWTAQKTYCLMDWSLNRVTGTTTLMKIVATRDPAKRRRFSTMSIWLSRKNGTRLRAAAIASPKVKPKRVCGPPVT